jgi:hypothetical protein
LEETISVLNKEAAGLSETVVDVTFSVTNAAGSVKTFVDVNSTLTMKVEDSFETLLCLFYLHDEAGRFLRNVSRSLFCSHIGGGELL